MPGKSTILPLHLLDEPWLASNKIVMLEPRRLAAKAVATRMASLKEEKQAVPSDMACASNRRQARGTRLHVVTEGILTRMIQSDNSLEGGAQDHL